MTKQSRKQPCTSREQSQDGKCCARAGIPQDPAPKAALKQNRGTVHSLTLQESIREVAVPTDPAGNGSDSARGSEMVAGMTAQGCQKSHGHLGIAVPNPTSQHSPATEPLNFRQGWHAKKGKERSFCRS